MSRPGPATPAGPPGPGRRDASRPAPDRWIDAGWLAALVILGLLLRLPALRLGLWRDEASTFFDVSPATLGEMFRTVARCELNPPGFFVVMRQWVALFGAGEVAFKLPALLFGLSLVPAAYALGRTIDSRATGLVAAGFAAFAPEAVYYSQEARPYAMAALLSCLAVRSYLRALRAPRPLRDLAWFTAWASLLVYTQYTGGLIVGVLAVATAWLAWRREAGVRWVPLGLAFGVVGLLFAPWLPTFLVHHRTGTPWSSALPWTKLGGLLLHNVIYTFPLTGIPRSLLLAGALAGWIAQFAVSRRGTGDRVTPARIILGGIVALLIGAETALSFGGRYLVPVAALAWVVYASFALTLWRLVAAPGPYRRPRMALRASAALALACLLVVPAASRALRPAGLPKSGVRSLTAELERSPLDSTVFIVAPDYLGPTFGYYAAREPAAALHGFARWDSPQLFSPRGYAELWNSPTVVADTERRIEEQARRGCRRIAFIWEAPPVRSGRMPYGKTYELLNALRRGHRLLGQVYYRGTQESVTLSLFSLDPDGH
jgi:hypothetical protein